MIQRRSCTLLASEKKSRFADRWGTAGPSDCRTGEANAQIKGLRPQPYHQRDFAQTTGTRPGLGRSDTHQCQPDSLVREKFAQLTRRDQMDRVLEGLEEVARYPSIRPIKINAVAIRAFSEEEVLALVQFARSKAYRMRWIEFMPLDADQRWRKEEILTGGEIKAIIEAVYGPLVPVPGDPAETARRYTFSDGIGEVGFINPVSEPFCATCDRIRLTADGQLRTCLFATTETDLRACVPFYAPVVMTNG